MIAPRALLAVAVALGAVMFAARPAVAHDTSLARSIITLDADRRGAEVRLTLAQLDLDALRARGGDGGLAAALVAGLTLDGPAGACRASTATAWPAAAGQAAFRWRLRCPGPPTRVRCALLLDVIPGHVHLARLVDRGASTLVAFAAERRTAELAIARAAPRWRGFVALGARHIAGGADHLLFLLTLLLVAATARELALAVTGFTVGHAAALSLAVLGGVRPVAAGIEVLVAASIAVVAAEAAAARAGRAGRHVPVAVAGGLLALAALAAVTGGRAPLALIGVALLAGCYLTWSAAAPGRGRLAITTGFGLVHGFAFAGALADLDVHGAALAVGLVGFNLGIELTQLALLGIGWALLARARRHAPRFAELAVEVAAGAALVPVTGWLIVRAL